MRSALETGVNTSLIPFWIRILTQIADALLYMHMNANILHNDLHVENVVLEESLVDEDGVYNASIVHFAKASVIGMASSRLTLNAGEVNEAIGKYPHIAPEIWRGGRHSRSSDMFSFGHLLKVVAHFLRDHCTKSFYIICKDVDPAKRPNAGSCLVYLNSYKFH